MRSQEVAVTEILFTKKASVGDKHMQFACQGKNHYFVKGSPPDGSDAGVICFFTFRTYKHLFSFEIIQIAYFVYPKTQTPSNKYM
jgi:hypothetical protein